MTQKSVNSSNFFISDKEYKSLSLDQLKHIKPEEKSN